MGRFVPGTWDMFHRFTGETEVRGDEGVEGAGGGVGADYPEDFWYSSGRIP